MRVDFCGAPAPGMRSSPNGPARSPVPRRHDRIRGRRSAPVRCPDSLSPPTSVTRRVRWVEFSILGDAALKSLRNLVLTVGVHIAGRC